MVDKAKKDKKAAASFVLGLLFWFPLLNFLFGALAIYIGLEALKDGRGQRMGIQRAFAVAGILLGAIPFYFGLLVILKSLLNLDDATMAVVGFFTTPAVLAILLIALKAKKLI